MTPNQRLVAIPLIRFLAQSQAFAVVVIHGAWLLLALTSWQSPGLQGDFFGPAARGLLKTYAWLGGVDSVGHGDAGMLVGVWLKVSVVITLLDALFRKLSRAPRRTVSLRMAALCSGVLALAGFSLALLPAAGDRLGALLFALLIAVLAGAAAAWALLARRVGDNLVRDLQPQAPGTAD